MTIFVICVGSSLLSKTMDVTVLMVKCNATITRNTTPLTSAVNCNYSI